MPRRYLKGKLMFLRIDKEKSITTGQSLLVVKLEDRFGVIYSWAPRWSDLISIVEQAKEVENTKKIRTTKGNTMRDYQIGGK